jgi:hypothetical protein
MARPTLRAAVSSALPPAAPAAGTAEQITQGQTGDTLEARSTSRRIKTVEDLLKHIEADLDRFQVVASEATKYECGDGNGGTVELHRVFVRLKPKAGPSVQECVEAMITAAKRELRRPAFKKPAKREGEGRMGLVVVSDLHIGSRCWRQHVGNDYDIPIAIRLAKQGTSELIERSAAAKVEKRVIALAGDTLHFDTIAGTTTAGTYIDRDSRLQKAIEAAAEAIFYAVDLSARTAATEVVVVPGNHDSAMTWALQKILVERYRGSAVVRVNGEYTSRKYISFGKNLIGITHGDKAKKKLAGIMALEASGRWASSVHREWHVGHLHHQAAEVSTIDGVLIRTHPTVVPPDSWHSESGFIGAERAMLGFVYEKQGGMTEMHVAYARR